MKHDNSEEHLIQFALGELDDSARAAVEEVLAHDKQLQATFEEIEATVQTLSAALTAHPGELDEVRRRAIEIAASSQPLSRANARPRSTRWTLVASAAAAMIAVMSGGTIWVGQQPTDEDVSLAGDRLEALQWKNRWSSPEFRSDSSDVVTEAPGNPFRIGNKQALEQIASRTAELEGIQTQRNQESVVGDWMAAGRAGQGGVELFVVPDENANALAMGPNLVDELDPPSLGPAPSSDATETVARRRAARGQLSNADAEALVSLGYLDSSSTAGPQRVAVENYVVAPERPAPMPTAESYGQVAANAFERVADAPLSTFSIDVDTASYSNVRRFLSQRQLPPREAVRIEEMVNYFSYDYPEPTGDAPFSAAIDVTKSPWNESRLLARVGLQGRYVPRTERQSANLVFLLDVSGSMQPVNKLPLVQQAMRLLLKQLQPSDRVAIVTYAGASRVALESTTVGEAAAIENAFTGLTADGSTNGAGGIQAAYRIAREQFVPGGINRVILATDGDFNVGITSHADLLNLISTEAKSDVFLTVLGFGMGNLKDATLELLADKGNGNYAYIDSFSEARKVFVEQLTSNLVTIAKDVKIQVEFNPAKIQAYRLIGYENRMLAAQDFNDDTKDAGEIGAGHTVTALYELIPVGAADAQPGVDELKYQSQAAPAPAAVVGENSDELFTVKLRYKQPEGDVSSKLEFPVADRVRRFTEISPDYQFACAVALFGMILRGDADAQGLALNDVSSLAESGLGNDPFSHRAEFMDLVRTAMELMPDRREQRDLERGGYLE